MSAQYAKRRFSDYHSDMSLSGKHLLVVDDDPKLRELVRRYLSENGFEVSIAQTLRQ